jgi:cytidylate kinase
VTVVAIDGPAGAGKSTVARAVALAALERGVPAAAIAGSLTIEPGERILVDGRDVTDEIRTRAVSEAASRAAADPTVRSAVAAQQRRLLSSGDWVAEGRDIGTVVAPEAELKVYLDADPRERARRRAAELGVDVDTVLAEQTIRDERDRTREHSPLAPADGAVVIDSTDMTLPEVVQRIAALARSPNGV